MEWSIDGVSKWLDIIGLAAYSDKFRENAVDGEVLLELGKDDLDYMEIKPLGHRKMLLKGVANLREQAGLATTGSVNGAAQSTSLSGGESQSAIATTTRVHWSQAKGPEPKGNGQGTSGDTHGILDEAKEHAEFAEALQEWRGQSGPIRLVREYKGERANDGASHGGARGTWSNPADAGKATLQYGLGAGDDGAPYTASSGTMSALLGLSESTASSGPASTTVLGGNATETPSTGTGTGTGTGAGAGTGTLLDGGYDEAGEQRRFKEALMEWRASQKPDKSGPVEAGVAPKQHAT